MKYQADAINYFLIAIAIFVIGLNTFLIFNIKPRFLWKKETQENSLPLSHIIMILTLFLASFFLGLMTYIMKLYNGFVL